MEINSDVEVSEIDQATLRKEATRDNNKENQKELYLEHLKMITSEAIKSHETEIHQLTSDIKA